MFDINKTIELIRGGLLEPKETWQSYLAENRGWQDTATLLTLPLIIVSFVLSGVLSWIFGSYYMFTVGTGFGPWLLSVIMAVVAIAAGSFIFSYLAGVFNGRHDFNKGLAAVTLTAIPGYVGGVLGTIPYIGWIISLALAIVSLVFLYQIIPSYLEVPQDKRVLHYVASLVATFIVMLILSAILGAAGMSSMPRDFSTSGDTTTGSGVLGSIQRNAQMMEQAQNDQYTPPADGMITEAQMDEFMTVMRKAADIRNEHMAKLDRLKKQTEEQGSDSPDLSTIMSGVGSAMGAFNAEMEVVMTGKKNWAEHQWVKNQLLTARVQKDINEAVKHNYALYQAHQDELEKLAPEM